MVNKIKIGLCLCLLLGMYTIAESYDSETKKIMPFVASESYCTQCHLRVERSKLSDPARACDTYCVTCHKDMERHHRVGVAIDNKIPGKIRTTEKNKLACISCHDLRTNRYDSKSYRSESLFESVFRIKSKYQTYYLVMRNNSGQICKICHD